MLELLLKQSLLRAVHARLTLTSLSGFQCGANRAQLVIASTGQGGEDANLIATVSHFPAWE